MRRIFVFGSFLAERKKVVRWLARRLVENAVHIDNQHLLPQILLDWSGLGQRRHNLPGRNVYE